MSKRAIIDLYRAGGLTAASSVLDGQVEYRAGRWHALPDWQRQKLTPNTIEHTARWAAEQGHADLCMALIPVVSKDSIARMLVLACEYGHSDLAQQLIGFCEPFWLRKDNARPLRAAAGAGLNDMVHQLLEYADHAGLEMALLHAVRARRHETVDVIDAFIGKSTLRSYALQEMYIKCVVTAAVAEDEALINLFLGKWSSGQNHAKGDLRNLCVSVTEKGSVVGLHHIFTLSSEIVPEAPQQLKDIADNCLQALCIKTTPWMARMPMFSYLLGQSSFATDDGGLNRQKLFNYLRPASIQDVELMFAHHQQQQLKAAVGSLEHPEPASPKARKL